MLLRDAVAEDFEALWQIDQQCFPPGIAYSKEELRSFLQGPGGFTLVAFAEKQIAGFIVLNLEEVSKGRIAKEIGHVITIDVLPEFRRSGVGSLLLKAAEERLAGDGCSTLLLETAVNNESALRFYHKHSFEILKTLPRYYPDGLDGLMLGKKLPCP